MKFIPSILSDQPQEIKNQLEKLRGIDELVRVQLDVIDGIFADNVTITPADFGQFNFDEFEADIHLMTDEPIDFVHELIDYRHSLVVNAVIGQVEHMSSQSYFLEEVKTQGWQPGLSLDAYSPIEAIDDESWEKLEVIQVMGIKAGFQKQELIHSTLDLVRKIRKHLRQNDLHAEIIFDGGVKLENIALIEAAGVGVVTIGSGFWQSADIRQKLQEYQQKLELESSSHD